MPLFRYVDSPFNDGMWPPERIVGRAIRRNPADSALAASAVAADRRNRLGDPMLPLSRPLGDLGVDAVEIPDIRAHRKTVSRD